MSNFAVAIVTIVYALVCLTNDADKGKGTTSKSAEDCSKNAEEGELYTRTLIEQKKFTTPMK